MNDFSIFSIDLAHVSLAYARPSAVVLPLFQKRAISPKEKHIPRRQNHALRRKLKIVHFIAHAQYAGPRFKHRFGNWIWTQDLNTDLNTSMPTLSWPGSRAVRRAKNQNLTRYRLLPAVRSLPAWRPKHFSRGQANFQHMHRFG